MSSSGLIRLVIQIPESLVLDETELVSVLADDTSPSEKQLSVYDYFHEEVSNAGLDNLLGLKDWDYISPGFWLVEGHLWGEVDYWGEADGGFEVEKAEPLDMERLITDWLMGMDADSNLAYLFHAQLNSENEFMRKGAYERLTTLNIVLSLLGTLYEDKYL